MIQELPGDIEEAISAKVASGKYADRNEVLREALASLDEFDEDAVALQRAIDRWRAGDKGIPLQAAFEIIRREISNP